MNCDVHRIVSKRQRQRFQQLPAGCLIGIGDGFVYHGLIMLSATNSPRVSGAAFSVLGPTPSMPETGASDFRSNSKRTGVRGLFGLVS